MPEHPDITVYRERLEAHVGGKVLEGVRVQAPFLLRSVEPPLSAANGRRVLGFRNIGKRIVWELEGDLFLVLHLMVAGRLRLKDAGVKIPKRWGLAAFDFEHASILLTEAGTKRRASLYSVQGEAGLVAHDRGGIEVIGIPFATFMETLRRENHTLKRALTDPRILSGIGNAYSDEILHRARLSPFLLTKKMKDPQYAVLYKATQEVLLEWTDRLRAEVGDGFPDKVTAFHDAMAVHGKYKEPCPDCGAKIQRIRYADNETNYCASCQNAGRLLADRGLSRLLKKNWTKTLDELETRSNRSSALPSDQ